MEEKIVRVKWLDAGCESLQLNEEDAKKTSPMPRENVGYLLADNEEKVVVAFGIVEDRDRHIKVYDQTLVVPKGMVLEVKELNER